MLVGIIITSCNKNEFECPEPSTVPEGYFPVKWVGEWVYYPDDEVILVYGRYTGGTKSTPWPEIIADVEADGYDVSNWDKFDHSTRVDEAYIKVDFGYLVYRYIVIDEIITTDEGHFKYVE